MDVHPTKNNRYWSIATSNSTWHWSLPSPPCALICRRDRSWKDQMDNPPFTLWLCQNSYWKWPSRNSGFSHWKWWFSIAFLMFTRPGSSMISPSVTSIFTPGISRQPRYIGTLGGGLCHHAGIVDLARADHGRSVWPKGTGVGPWILIVDYIYIIFIYIYVINKKCTKTKRIDLLWLMRWYEVSSRKYIL